MAMANARTLSQPMMEMNTTPLIDVMLVLLIMFIITIPVATHSVEFNVGEGKPVKNRVDPLFNKVVVTADNQILWNDGTVTEGELSSLLQQARQLRVEPELQFQPQAQASYSLAAKVTNIIKRSGVTNFGFVGNEQYSEFGKAAEAK